jgi:hypothetical protein
MTALIIEPNGSTSVVSEARSDDVVIRIPRTESVIAFKLDTRRLAERREIERANEEIRHAGK